MKSLMLIFGVVISGVMIYSLETNRGALIKSGEKPKSNAVEYSWKLKSDVGSGSFEEKWEKGKWPMGLIPIVAFEDKLWVIGQERSWSSKDGILWDDFSKNNWGERYGMSFVFFQNKLWMMGGMKNWGDFRNDIWVSSDGGDWRKVVDHALWSERVRHKTIVFKDKLWLIGGTVSSGNSSKLPSVFLNDIWSSSDGVRWTRELENAPWQQRHDPKVIVFKNKLWMIGGTRSVDDGGMNDVWNSSDGIHWELVTENAPWDGRRNNGVLVFNDHVWVFGGIGKNDVWYSSDGLKWKSLEKAPWSTRTTENSVVYKNELLIFSGKTGRADSWSGEIWALSK